LIFCFGVLTAKAGGTALLDLHLPLKWGFGFFCLSALFNTIDYGWAVYCILLYTGIDAWTIWGFYFTFYNGI
jgi:hypothetical protein